MRAVLDLASVTPERHAVVLSDIEIGSQPTATYYVLLSISELIAAFALIIGSDATLIGANVVAPLMTPIIGISLGLMRGDLRLLRTALLAEFGGALIAVVLMYLLGLMPFWGDPTPSLLAQTKPTLIDLLVAALAGFAGVLAMIDERVSPALPGVAIATALNPPVAAIGLCLAFGAYQGAWGAFLLFFANVLAILAVAAVLFLIAGFVTWAEIGSVRGLARRFAPAAIGLLLVTALLTKYLVGMVENIHTQRAITAVLDQELAHEPSTALFGVDFSRGKDGVDVLAEVRTPHVPAPGRVKEIQDALGSRLGEPVHLFMRCTLTKDVTATGSTTLRPYLSLNGKVTTAPVSPDMRLLATGGAGGARSGGDAARHRLEGRRAGEPPDRPGHRRLHRELAAAEPRPHRALRSPVARALGGAERARRRPRRRISGHHLEGTRPVRRGALRRRDPRTKRNDSGRLKRRCGRICRACRTPSSRPSMPCAASRVGRCARRSWVHASSRRTRCTASKNGPRRPWASRWSCRCGRARTSWSQASSIRRWEMCACRRRARRVPTPEARSP